ncbi:hypothetical protein DXZ75_09890 [Streptomyces sp. AcE210]|nr:hypothetical protein DXZ75_09890 [Streptomyces sp. AcE210]
MANCSREPDLDPGEPAHEGRTQNLFILLLALVVFAALSPIAGLIGYNVAREAGSPVSTAISRGSFVFFRRHDAVHRAAGRTGPDVM